ncbi:hypothetical protein ABZ341_41240 [Streptomyces sp. NPDC006173]|uniref:hypothetical protein n=1 Tax=Streptomyces sp. NPDC006173 TaxID=3155349 RepID=UPI0033F33A20
MDYSGAQPETITVDDKAVAIAVTLGVSVKHQVQAGHHPGRGRRRGRGALTLV